MREPLGQLTRLAPADQFVQRRELKSLDLPGLEFRKAARISPAVTARDVHIEPGSDHVEFGGGNWFSRIQAMRDVDEPSAAEIAHELGRSARHVCHDNWRGIT